MKWLGYRFAFHTVGAFLTFLPHLFLSEGLLKVGVPQPWDTSKKNNNYIRKAGVRQFISTYNRVKDLKGDELLWGDEIEYGIFSLDRDNKKIRLSLRAKEVSSRCAVPPQPRAPLLGVFNVCLGFYFILF